MTPPQAEGVAAAKSFIQPVGELRQACSLVITPATIRVFAGPRCGPARDVGRGIGGVGGGGGSGIAAMSNGACSES